MISELVSRSSSPRSSPGRGVVFSLCKTINSLSSSLHTGVKISTGWVILRWPGIPSQWGVEMFPVASCYRNRDKPWAHMQTVLFDAQIFLHLCKRTHVMWAPTTSNLKASTLSNVGRLRQVSDTIFLCKLNLLHVYDYRLARDNCPTMIHSGQHLRVLTESLYLSKYLLFSTVQTVVLFVHIFVR